MDVAHPQTSGGTGKSDTAVLARCLEEDRTLVTRNAGDFRKLIGREELHPGLIIVDDASRAVTEKMVRAAIAYIDEARGSEARASFMINRVVEVSQELQVASSLLPEL